LINHASSYLGSDTFLDHIPKEQSWVLLVELFSSVSILKEIDLGLAADLGTLQKFPKIIGNDR